MSTLLLRTVAGGLAGIYTFYGVTVCALLLHLLWLAGRTPTMAIYLLWVYTYYGYLPTMGVYLLYSQCGAARRAMLSLTNRLRGARLLDRVFQV